MGCPGGKPKSSDSPNIGEQRILMNVHEHQWRGGTTDHTPN